MQIAVRQTYYVFIRTWLGYGMRTDCLQEDPI
jgi:hypothetical protein